MKLSYTSVRHAFIFVITLVVTIVFFGAAFTFMSSDSSFQKNINLRIGEVSCEGGKPKVILTWDTVPSTTFSVQRRTGSFDGVHDSKGVIAASLDSTTYTDVLFDDSSTPLSYHYRIILIQNDKPRFFSESVEVVMPMCAATLESTSINSAGTSTDANSVSQPIPVTQKETPVIKNPGVKVTATSFNPTNVPVVKATSTVTQPMPTSPSPISTTNTYSTFPSWMKWGAYVGWKPDNMNQFESVVGKAPQLEAAFSHWGNDDFPTIYNERVRNKGRTLILFWEAVDYERPYFNQPEYSFDSVINGSLDAYFTRYARDAKAYGGPVILIPYSEFNGDWYPWSVTVGDNTPEKFKNAWIHIRTIFAKEDATNVKFGWVANTQPVPDVPKNNFDLYYPGTSYVDVVGLDVFNFNSDWMSFDQMAHDSLLKLRKYNKPMYIFSMAAAENSKKADWIRQTFTKDLYQYPEVKGWVWFNENKEEDWRVNSSAEALQAFKGILP